MAVKGQWEEEGEKGNRKREAVKKQKRQSEKRQWEKGDGKKTIGRR